MKLEGLTKGQLVSVRFPMREEDTIEELHLTPGAPSVQFRVHWRGNTVVSLSPKGKYDRRSLATSSVPMRRVKSYFIPAREIDR